MMVRFPRCRPKAIATGTALAALVMIGCNRTPVPPADKSPASDKANRLSDGYVRCERSKTVLPIVPIVVEWQRDQTVRSLSLASGGEVLQKQEIVGRVVGGCILDPKGDVLVSVASDANVLGKHGERMGVFQTRDTLRDSDGAAIPVGETLMLANGSVWAITPEGSVYSAIRDQPAFSIPATVNGTPWNARRTALLLLALGNDLDQAPPAAQ
jgi:hypothetical protein